MPIWDFSKVTSINDYSKSVKDIIIAEAKSLNDFTKGKVKAEFGQIHLSSDTIRTVAAVMSAITETGVSYENSSNLNDANKLYNVENYGFEIHNNKYKFRIFEIKVSANYPMEITVDSDIYEDEVEKMSITGAVPSNKNTVLVGTEETLRKVLGLILNNRKVIYIISRMLSDEKG